MTNERWRLKRAIRTDRYPRGHAEAAKKFAEKEFDSDLALELDREGKFPKALFEKACQLGFVGIDYPEEFGGQSLGLLENVLVTEEFCKKDSGMGTAMGLGDLASGIILRHGSEGRRKAASFLSPRGRRSHGGRDGSRRGPAKAEATDSGYVLTGKRPSS